MKTFHTIQSTIRRGVTLSEVLVSLLVMSVGVIAVATLFPLSVLRTVQATQLTNAAQLRHNFEGMAGARPEVFAGAEAWQPGRAYAVGDLIVASLPTEYYFECTATANTSQSGALEPVWDYRQGQSTQDNDADMDGTGDITWMCHRARVFVVDPLGWQNRTEELTAVPAINTANIRNSFGRIALTGGTAPNDSRYRIVRFRGGIPGAALNPSSSTFWPDLSTALGRNQDIASKFGARQMAVLPDSWVLQTDTTEITTPATPVTMLRLNNLPTSLIQTLDRNGDSIIDLVVTPGAAAERDISARATLYDVTGTVSHVRQLTRIDSPSAGVEELTWTGALPIGFTPARVKVETFETRYSWMLTGRHNGPTSYLNLVVFFRRSSDPADELIHPAHFNLGGWAGANNTVGNNDDVADLSVSTLGAVTAVLRAGADGQPGVATVDDDGVGGTDNATEFGYGDDITPRPLVVIRYNADIPAGEKPFLKRGGYICDSQNNRWYRILKFAEVADAAAAQGLLHGASATALPAGPGAVVWLDNPILENSGYYIDPDPAAPPRSSSPGAILIPGIIDVYPLQPRLPWEN